MFHLTTLTACRALMIRTPLNCRLLHHSLLSAACPCGSKKKRKDGAEFANLRRDQLIARIREMQQQQAPAAGSAPGRAAASGRVSNDVYTCTMYMLHPQILYHERDACSVRSLATVSSRNTHDYPGPPSSRHSSLCLLHEYSQRTRSNSLTTYIHMDVKGLRPTD
jgi:hypothetical protein